MNQGPTKSDKKMQLIALACLLILGGLALVGPYGLLSWSEQSAKLENRDQQIVQLQEEQDVLRNRVELLDPENVDPDLASELVRRDLNVAHRDEYVVDLESQP